ncbi:SHOCT domain-containing protein [Candidatus Woesearchaeota archaeon]|nr:SHOCT domain-containing protein [Candidatus Woesearchaeota archaeon]
MVQGMMQGYGMGYGNMAFGWAFQLVILVLFFLVIWWMLRSSSSFGFKCRENESAIEILKKRLAKGEIDAKEYEKLKKEIEK